MPDQKRTEKPILKQSTSHFSDICTSIKAGMTNHWSKLLTKNEIRPCPFNICSSTVHIPEKNDVQLSKGEERWVWPRDALNNSGKKIDSSKKNTKLKVNILKRKYWYEEPKPLKFYNKYSMGAKAFSLGLSEAPRS